MISYYRKYRPQKTSDLDLTDIREFFSSILTSGKFSHAYLFSGPRGSGKTSAARILAKVINCAKNQTTVKKGKGKLVEPCGRCQTCSRISTSSSLAVIEMDAASNRGIDDIRALRERISLAPAEGSHIVYIIDEVHMLTNEAFNALLKTLEEPPVHAVFVLATTEPHKLPETIISRCTQLVFQKATTKEVIRSLNKVIKGEKLSLDKNSLKLLASSVDGSFRDGIKLLEVLAQKGKRISHKAVTEAIGRSKEYDVNNFIDLLKDKNISELLKVIANNEKVGVNPSVFITRLTEALREAMLTNLKENDQEEVNQNIKLLELFQEASISLKTTVIPTLPLEIAVAQYCLDTHEYDQPKEQGSVTPAPIIRTTSYKQKTTKPKKETTPTPKENYKKDSVELHALESKWGEVLTGVKPLNHSLEALLRATRPIECEGPNITIEVFYQFHKDQLEQDRHRRQIEHVISNIFDFPAKLYFVLGERKPASTTAPKKETVENISGKVADEDLAAAAEEIFGN